MPVKQEFPVFKLTEQYHINDTIESDDKCFKPDTAIVTYH
jgi:hypothetical protein